MDDYDDELEFLLKLCEKYDIDLSEAREMLESEEYIDEELT